ncbi:MAG: hypothetical protein Q7T83_04640 [Thermodesulfovibrionales bacterium]|nr:hypothetical protein [Thermodesulfovibrionales bacterium]
MVMVIIAILAAVVIIRNPFDSIKLYSATRKVAADIRYVQKLSISNQTRAGMVFNGDYGYSVYPNINAAPLAISPGDPCSSWEDTSKLPPNIFFVVDFRQDRCSNYSGVTLSTATPTIAFNSLGTPVTSVGGAINADQYVTVTYNGSKQITIEQGTGRVSIP